MGSAEQKKRFLEYVEQHPEYYPLMQAGVFVRILKTLAKEAKGMDDMAGILPDIDKEDLAVMVEALMGIKIVSKLFSAGQLLYYTNDLGKEFLSYYDLAKEKFEVA